MTDADGTCGETGSWRATAGVAHGLDWRACTNETRCAVASRQYMLRDAAGKYNCPRHAGKHEWVPLPPCRPFVASELVHALRDKLVCFWGDSLTAQQADALKMEASAKEGEPSTGLSRLYNRYFGEEFGIRTHFSSFLFSVHVHGRSHVGADSRNWTLDMRTFDAPEWLSACDVLVVNTYLWWGGLGAVYGGPNTYTTYARSIGRVIYPDWVAAPPLQDETLSLAWALLFQALHARGGRQGLPALKPSAQIFYNTWPGWPDSAWQARLVSARDRHGPSVRLLNTTAMSAYGHGSRSHHCDLAGPRTDGQTQTLICDHFHFCNRNSVPMIWNLLLARAVLGRGRA